MTKRIRIGFTTGTILAVTGVMIRLFARFLASSPISPHASTINSGLEAMWVQVSLATIIFGASLFLVTFNRWLAMDDESDS